MKLTNRSKHMAKKPMTLAERAYLPAILTGMGITLKHFFSKKATIRYPEELRPIAPTFRTQSAVQAGLSDASPSHWWSRWRQDA